MIIGLLMIDNLNLQMQSKILDLLKENNYSAINDYLNCFFNNSHLQYLKNYFLLIGSKQDNEDHMNETIVHLEAMVSNISNQLSLYNLICSYKHIHRNEKIECYYKTKNGYGKTIEMISSICQLCVFISEQNKKIISERNSNKYTIKELSLKVKMNTLIDQSVIKINKAKVNVGYYQMKQSFNSLIQIPIPNEETELLNIDQQYQSIEIPFSNDKMKPNYIYSILGSYIKIIKELLLEYRILLFFFGIIILFILHLSL